MSILGTLFGTKSVVEGAVDSVKNITAKDGLLDNAFFTDQEKSQAALASTNAYIELQKVLASENSLKSITRRVMAWSILGNFLLVVDIGVVLVLLKQKEMVESLKTWVVDSNFGWMAASVVAFYFVYYGVSGLFNKKNGK